MTDNGRKVEDAICDLQATFRYDSGLMNSINIVSDHIQALRSENSDMKRLYDENEVLKSKVELLKKEMEESTKPM